MSGKWEKEFPNLDKLADTVGQADVPSGLGIDRKGLWKEIHEARAIIGAEQKIPGVKFIIPETGFFTGPEQDDDVCPVCKRPM